MHGPDAARTNAGAYAATDTAAVVRDIGERAVFLYFPGNSLFRARFFTHMAVAASAAADAAQIILFQLTIALRNPGHSLSQMLLILRL